MVHTSDMRDKKKHEKKFFKNFLKKEKEHQQKKTSILLTGPRILFSLLDSFCGRFAIRREVCDGFLFLSF